jgi:hypothetical protein
VACGWNCIASSSYAPLAGAGQLPPGLLAWHCTTCSSFLCPPAAAESQAGNQLSVLEEEEQKGAPELPTAAAVPMAPTTPTHAAGDHAASEPLPLGPLTIAPLHVEPVALAASPRRVSCLTLELRALQANGLAAGVGREKLQLQYQ